MKYLVYIAFFLSLMSCRLSKFSKGKMVYITSQSYSFPIESIDGIIVLNVKVNGVDGRFILDNGFSLCALDQQFAKRAGVEFQKKGAVNDANNNTVELLETRVDSISVGPFILNNSLANQLETALFLPCDSIDGILGASFINRMNWKIDFENKIATISTEVFLSSGIPIKFETARNNISTIQLEIGGKTLKTMVDFGYQGYLQIHKNNYTIPLEGQKSEVRVGIQSLSVSGLGSIDTIYICNEIPLSFNGTKILPTSELMIKSNICEDAILGINYFENYEVVINNSNKEFLLKPRKNYITPVKNNFNIGLYSINSEIKIVQLNINDPVKDKVELLQKVVTIDGKPSSELNDICVLKAYFKLKRLNNESVMILVEGNPNPIEVHAKNPIKQLITNP